MVSLPKVQSFWSLMHKSTCLQHLVLLPGCNYAITLIPGKKTRKQKVCQVRQPFRWRMTASNLKKRVKLSINLLINMWVNKCNVYQREWRVSQFSSFIPSLKISNMNVLLCWQTADLLPLIWLVVVDQRTGVISPPTGQEGPIGR